MDTEKNVLAYCRSCRQVNHHNVLFKAKRSSHPDEEFGWTDEYSIVECNGCKTISFQKEYSDEDMINSSEDGQCEYYSDVKLFPPFLTGHKQISDLYFLPNSVRVIYEETLDAFKAKCKLLTLAGFRAIIEAICKEENIGGRDLNKKIEHLVRAKLITDREAKRLHVIRFLGNDSLHEIKAPSDEKLYIILDTIEHLIRNLYTIDKSLADFDTVIEDFESFKRLLFSKISKGNIAPGEEKTLRDFLGKDIRRLLDKIQFFEVELTKSIKDGSTKFLSMGKVAVNKKNEPVQYYVTRN